MGLTRPAFAVLQAAATAERIFQWIDRHRKNDLGHHQVMKPVLLERTDDEHVADDPKDHPMEEILRSYHWQVSAQFIPEALNFGPTKLTRLAAYM